MYEEYENEREWYEIEPLTRQQLFQPFSEFFSTYLDFTDIQAESFFTQDYKHALTYYTNAELLTIFSAVWETNKQRYRKLGELLINLYDPLAGVDMYESYTDVRTPELTTSTASSGSSSGTIANHQTKTTTETPNSYQTTNVHSVNPYDGTGFRTENQDVSTETGSRTATETYTGDPDTTSSTSSGLQTTNEGGKETITHTLQRVGNNGTRAPAELADLEYNFAQKLNLFKTIEKDIAAKIFLQVWR